MIRLGASARPFHDVGLLAAIRAARPSRLFALSPSLAGFERRGFTAARVEMRERLENVGRVFLEAANHALALPSTTELLRYCETVRPDHRGFAVEGATFGIVMADAVNLGPPQLLGWFAAVDARYTYLAHVGCGWGVARLPWRRSRIAVLLDPVHCWLVEDGTGFHDCFFQTARVLRGWRRLRSGYAARAYDQGVGRALWFASGGDVASAMTAARRMSDERTSDLLSGLGLAVSYAGGASLDELRRGLQSLRPPERGAFAQGAAFAAEAMVRAGNVHDGADDVIRVAAGCSLEDSAALVRECRRRLPACSGTGEVPYEVWRSDVQRALGGAPERGAA